MTSAGDSKLRSKPQNLVERFAETHAELRDLQTALSPRVFHRRQPLTPRYCQARLKTYGKRCRVDITPHQLRHSYATRLLNAGAPALSVQSLLGHEKLDTTLGYARLYDTCTYMQVQVWHDRGGLLPRHEAGRRTVPPAGK